MSNAACSEIIVAGFHRSGTSSAARLLHAAGLFVGDDLIGALPYNPYGHYEDRVIVRLHDQILRDNGTNWQVVEDFVALINPTSWQDMERFVSRRRRMHRLWGFKDPRVCLFLPAWKHVMPSCKVLISFRHPADCSYSLSRRHASELLTVSGPEDIHRRFFDEPDLAPRMWLVHNRALLSFADRYPDDVLAVGFDSLLRGFPLTQLVRRSWGAPLNEAPTFSALDPMATQQRDHPQPLADPRLADELDAVWAALEELERRSVTGLDDLGLSPESRAASTPAD
jgi:hypothetical protein